MANQIKENEEDIPIVSLEERANLFSKEDSLILGEQEYERAISLIISGHKKEAMSLFQKSAGLNYPPSFLWLHSLTEDKNEEKNWKLKATPNFTWYQSKAQDGKPDSLLNLGYCFDIGIGTEINLIKATELYSKAAEKGFAAAQYNLGICYCKGEGVPKDMNKALEWFSKAAEQRNAEAMSYLGICYQFGEGVPKDMNRATELFSKAAEQGYAEAQCNIGWCYQNGIGVPKDLNRAIYFYNRAAEQGFARAQYNLGWCYENGIGVPKDMDKAIEFYTKAAEQGNAKAQCTLGVCYQDGEGVLKDYNKAIEWYSKAAERGLVEAHNNLSSIDAEVLAVALKVNNILTTLKIDNEIGDVGAHAIADALRVNKTLNKLDLSYNSIGDSGAQSIADALRVNRTITDLNISGNAIEDSGAEALLDTLKWNISLQMDIGMPMLAHEIEEILKRNKEIQTNLSKRIFECKNRHLSLLDYKILERVNVVVIFENVWKLHQTQQTGKTYEDCLREYWELISLNGFAKYFLFILGVCKLNQIPPFRSHLLGIPKEILNHIGSFLNPNDFTIDFKKTHQVLKTQNQDLKKQSTNKRKRT